MKMNFRQFMVFVCDLMFCLMVFCLCMQAKPTPNAWAITALSAGLVILLIFLYFFFNALLDSLFDF